jgi:hypothetical protein
MNSPSEIEVCVKYPLMEPHAVAPNRKPFKPPSIMRKVKVLPKSNTDTEIVMNSKPELSRFRYNPSKNKSGRTSEIILSSVKRLFLIDILIFILDEEILQLLVMPLNETEPIIDNPSNDTVINDEERNNK